MIKGCLYILPETSKIFRTCCAYLEIFACVPQKCVCVPSNVCTKSCTIAVLGMCPSKYLKVFLQNLKVHLEIFSRFWDLNSSVPPNIWGYTFNKIPESAPTPERAL